jgi:hypothetical protein
LRTFRLGERRTEDAAAALEKPSVDVRYALLQAPQLRLRRVYFLQFRARFSIVAICAKEKKNRL